MQDSTILEIGSGWLPLLPILFKTELHVKNIITYDINKHYSKHSLQKLKMFFPDIEFNNKTQQRLGLPDFIDYYPHTNFISAAIGDHTVSFVFSRFVLEHVNPEDILKMHQKIYKEFRDDVKVLHLISPSDHRAYSDKSLSYYDFLKYSPDEWDAIQTKFDYHNRLRLPEYIELFKTSGFKVSYLDHDQVDKNSEKYRKFKALSLHRYYQQFTEEELLAGSICVLLEKIII